MDYHAADSFAAAMFDDADGFGLLWSFDKEDIYAGSPQSAGDHGFGPLHGSPAGGMGPSTAADMAISHYEVVGSNMASADAQPELAGGLDGQGEELYLATDTGNPSVEDSSQRLTVSDILSMLRKARDCWPGLSQQQKRSKYPVVVDLVDRMPDPWVSLSDHPEGFITKASNTKKTCGGDWKERRFTAIRGRSGDPEQPQYVGAQKTYEFHKNNGKDTKIKWLMHEYHLLDPHDDHKGLLLDEEDGLVFCVILRAADDEDEPGVSKEYQSPPKRRRSSAPNGESEVWQHFTKIYNKAGKLTYAACHDCDRIFGAQPKNGTSSLIRHNEKHLQPKSR